MRRGAGVLLALGASAVGMLALAGVANAAAFTVNDTTDAPLVTSSDTNCVSTHNSSCTLRAAIQAADNTGGSSTITAPAGTYTLTITSSGADDAATGDLDIDSDAAVTINGAGSGSTIIDANGIDRTFAVQKSAGLTLSGMTIENGSPSANSSGSQNGGAIYSDGALTLASDVTLRGNNSLNGSSGGGAIFTDNDQTALSITGATFVANHSIDGGAIYLSTETNEANVQQSITDSSFSSNIAVGNGTGEDGGAIDLEYGNLTVSGSTFSSNIDDFNGGGAIEDDPGTGETLTATNNVFEGNTAPSGGAIDYENSGLTASGNTFAGNGASQGGAIYQNVGGIAAASTFNNTFDGNTAYEGGGVYNALPQVTWSFRNNTLARNQASGAGGGIFDPAGSGSRFANNIVAENQGGDCSGTAITSTEDPGNNLDSDGSCFGANAGDKTSVNPDLGPLADNGGPTETDALLPGSPAFDAANDSLCPATDQRGIPRPEGTHCDIGAFEAAPAALSVSNSAPSNGVSGEPLAYKVTVTDNGPALSTGTTVTDELPSGETLYGATPSQGSCSASGSKVSCALGSINNVNNATVTLLVTESNPGSVTDTATATNDQGANVSASATTKLVAAPVGGQRPQAKTLGHKSVTTSRAKVLGKVSNGGQATWYFFQYGRTKKLGSVTGLVRISSSKNVSAKIKHLLAGRKYYFRLVAINDSGKSSGKIHSFRTK